MACWVYREMTRVNVSVVRIAVLASVLALAQTSARAQEPPVVEVTGGYAFLGAPGNNLPFGLFATGAWRATRHIALVRLRVRTLLGGVRFNVSTGRRLEPFVQGLTGASVVDIRVVDTGPFTDLFPPFDVHLDSTDFAARLGTGLTWRPHARVGAQIEATTNARSTALISDRCGRGMVSTSSDYWPARPSGSAGSRSLETMTSNTTGPSTPTSLNSIA
jgi:hypothetical protein